MAPRFGREAQAGAFVGSGAAVLAAGLTLVWIGLRSGSTMTSAGWNRLTIARLAVRNGARNPSRSALTVGLIAAASFLIVALSAFRLDPAAEGRGLGSGSGGFDLVAQSDQPIYQDLNSPGGPAVWVFGRGRQTAARVPDRFLARAKPATTPVV